MGGERAEWIEKAVERLAAAVFAAAAGFAIYALTDFDRVLLALAAGAIAFFICVRLLGMVRGEAPHLALPVFDLPELPSPEWEELLLTEMTELVLTQADRLKPARAKEELVLDDILAQLGPDSRVVRLFDPAAMPTPGQLKSRIDRHLQGETSHPSPHDASEALYEALAELRRSLS